MKIRQGFVSNSSSSSFIVKIDGDYENVYEVAKRMMLDIQDENDSDYSVELRELEKLSDKNTPVYFDQGDGGYLRKFKNYIIVSSSQHYDPTRSFGNEIVSFKSIGTEYFNDLEWYDVEYDEGTLEENGIRKITHSEDFDYYYEQFNDFLILKFGIYGIYDYDYNNIMCDCNDYRIIKTKNGETICECQIKKYIRKIKLEQIEKKDK
jgi:hypothetical protein